METLRDAFAEYLAPLTVVMALVYIVATYAVGVDPRWAWFAFPVLFSLVFWTQGRAVIALSLLVYLGAYAYLVGFGQLSSNGGVGAAALPAACVIVDVVGLLAYWTAHHIGKHSQKPSQQRGK